MEVSEIELAKLKKGDLVSLYNENKDLHFGSIGKSEQHFEYLGDQTFEVIKSSRSLEPGMKLSTRKKIWKVGDQINLVVKDSSGLNIRKLTGKRLSFSMRPITAIEIK